MRSSSSRTVSGRPQPCPSPSYRCSSTVRPSPAQLVGDRLRLRGRHDDIVGALQDQQRSGDLVHHRDRRTIAVAVDGVRQRPDDRVQVVLLEAVGRLVELEEVGDAEQIDSRGAQVGVMGEDVQDGEATGRSAHHHHATRVRPATMRSSAQSRGHVSGVEVAPAFAHRLQERTAVAARTAVVGHEHRVATIEPVQPAGVERDATLRAGTAMNRADERRRVAAGGRDRRTVEPAEHDGAVLAIPLDQLRLHHLRGLEAGDRAACDLGALPLHVVHDDLGRRASPAAQRGEPLALPAQRAVHASRDFLDTAGRDVGDAQPAEPALVAVERDAVAVRRPRERPLTRTPGGVAVLERLGEHGLRVEVAVEHPQVEEPVHVGEERGERAAWGEPDLLGLRVTRRERVQDLAAAVAATSRYLARVPRHVGNAPLLPRDPLRVGGERGVEAEVGVTGQAARPGAVVGDVATTT